MSDPNWLLSTLAQSTAAVVAIVGGFLVSRLVQLSSEKEGLRRRLTTVRDDLSHVGERFEGAHEYRLSNSQYAFYDAVIETVVTAEAGFDFEQVIAESVPRGSSVDEMTDYLTGLVQRVDISRKNIAGHLDPSDSSSVTIQDLEGRGMKVPERDRHLYDQVEEHVLSKLPKPKAQLGLFGERMNPLAGIRIPAMMNPAAVVTDERRLDESIREEQELLAQKKTLEAEVKRLEVAIDQIGRPVGVTSAVWILAAYSVLGMVAPVAVMALFPTALDAWLAWLLVGAFVAGLALVVGYIAWYSQGLGASSARAKD